MSLYDDAHELLDRLSRTGEKWTQLANIGEPGAHLAQELADGAERLSNLVRGTAASMQAASLAIKGHVKNAELLMFKAAHLLAEHPLYQSDNLRRLGNLRMAQHYFEEADRLFKDAIQLATAEGCHERIATVKICQGVLEYLRKEYYESANYLLGALSYIDPADDSRDIFPVAIHNLAVILVILDEGSGLDRFLDLETAVQDLRPRFPRLSMARVRVNWLRFVIDIREERLKPAIRGLNAVLTRFLKQGGIDEVVAAGIDLAQAYYMSGNLEKMRRTVASVCDFLHDKLPPEIEKLANNLEAKQQAQAIEPWALRRQLVVIRQPN